MLDGLTDLVSGRVRVTDSLTGSLTATKSEGRVWWGKQEVNTTVVAFLFSSKALCGQSRLPRQPFCAASLAQRSRPMYISPVCSSTDRLTSVPLPIDRKTVWTRSRPPYTRCCQNKLVEVNVLGNLRRAIEEVWKHLSKSQFDGPL